MEQKEFVASMFKTFSLDLKTLPSRIAFQKTIYLLQELSSKNDFTFRWNNFGPYSSALAHIGFSINEVDVIDAQIVTGPNIERFKELVKGHEKDSKFLEILADIIFIKKDMKKNKEEEIFLELVNHRTYLNDRDLFKLAIERLSKFNLI
ncbi:hypothetical protein M0R19_06380 [Candidatus Pacearchaeota archaeon]|jgi:uncharacterized protein YwgA|nr:hypothetical protein [Candidatus Pacearchaeota archaeon]